MTQNPPASRPVRRARRTGRSALAAGLAALLLPAAQPTLAQQTGGITAQCQIMGQPAALDLRYEALNTHGITVGPGANPEITGVIRDGGVTVYWNGTLSSSMGSLPISGENYFLRFYDQNVLNRETVLEVRMTGQNSFTLTDVYGNYPGSHPCQITRQW